MGTSLGCGGDEGVGGGALPLKAQLLLGTKVDAMGLGLLVVVVRVAAAFEKGTPGEAGQRLCCPVAGLWECAARVE